MAAATTLHLMSVSPLAAPWQTHTHIAPSAPLGLESPGGPCCCPLGASTSHPNSTPCCHPEDPPKQPLHEPLATHASCPHPQGCCAPAGPDPPPAPSVGCMSSVAPISLRPATPLSFFANPPPAPEVPPPLLPSCDSAPSCLLVIRVDPFTDYGLSLTDFLPSSLEPHQPFQVIVCYTTTDAPAIWWLDLELKSLQASMNFLALPRKEAVIALWLGNILGGQKSWQGRGFTHASGRLVGSVQARAVRVIQSTWQLDSN